MTTNELKALVMLQRAEMLYWRGQGSDTMDACQCIERCAWYLHQDAPQNAWAERWYSDNWEKYLDEDFQAGEYDQDELWKDIVILREWFTHAGRNFMFNLEDF